MNEQLKMFIAGEEVVSKNQFTIENQMLSASSTILNNCYPASWELNKDYVSNFYYPKDYSRFVIGKGTFDYGNDEFKVLDVSGTDYLDFNTNVNKEWNKLTIYGNTYQETSTEGSGKNLLCVGNITNTLGLTITKVNNSAIQINGTANATGDVEIELINAIELGLYSYTFSCRCPGGTASNNFIADIPDSTTLMELTLPNSAISRTTSSDNGNTFTLLTLSINSGTQFNNLIVQMQLEQGPNMTSFEPYYHTNNMPSPDYPSEIVNVGYQNMFNYNEASDVNNTYVTQYRVYKIDKLKPNTKYYVYNYDINEATPDTYIYLWSTDQYSTSTKSYISSPTGYSSKANLVSNANGEIYLAIYDTTTTTWETYIEKFKNAMVCEYDNSSFINYGLYGIEVKNTNGTSTNKQVYELYEPLRAIGDVKDTFYIENNKLYVEKKIGSIVLNGTEYWGAGTQVSSSNFYRYENVDFRTNNCLVHSPYLSDKFIYNNTEPLVQKNVITNTSAANTNRLWITIDTSLIGGISTSNFTSWLSTNNTELLYILAEPTLFTREPVEIPNSYEGQNNVEFITGLSTTESINYYWKNYDVLFSGIVKNSGEISLRPQDPKYCSLQVLDYKTFLSECDTLDFVISNKTISEAINMVVEKVAGYGFEIGRLDIIQANDVIGAYSTLNQTPYDVLQYLANISQSRWLVRVIDSQRMAIDFYDPDLLPQTNNIEYTKEYFEDNNIINLSFNYGTRDYRNKQIILSDIVYGDIDYTQNIYTDGYTQEFLLESNIGSIKSITVNGKTQEVITKDEKDIGVDGDFYYTPGQNTITSDKVLSVNNEIKVIYVPLVQGRQIVYNSGEVDRIKEQTGTIGIISRYETRNDILSSQELNQVAQSYITYKGKPEIILNIQTKEKDLFDIGEVAYFNSPIDDLKENYMVKSKNIEYIVINGTPTLFYEYELTSSYNSEKAINYFDNQRNKAQGNIQLGDTITRNIDIENEATIIWQNLNITEVEIDVENDNVLNSELNSPFVE